uniref:Laminin IV type B domain-containing protein n=1 Tax=Timema cristinae TaxID=61476 RepID=A0A7R9CU57_TIMCR|nr:unnamed protein product [Timema cristinae]
MHHEIAPHNLEKPELPVIRKPDEIALVPRIESIPFFRDSLPNEIRRQEFERYRCGQAYYEVLVSVIPQVQLALYVVLLVVHVSVNLMWLVVPVIAVLQELMVLDQKVVKSLELLTGLAIMNIEGQLESEIPFFHDVGSEPAFGRRETGKPFRENHPSSPDLDLNLELPVLGGLAQQDWRHVIATLLVLWTTSVIPKLVSVNVVLIHTVENVTNVNQDFGIFQTVNAVNVMDLLTLVTHEQELAFNAKILHSVTTATG